MAYIKRLVNYLRGRCEIPPQLHRIERPTVLVVSDTPSTFYKEFQRVITLLKPDYIIHAGDLVDDIKLEIYPRRLPEYEKALMRLANILESSNTKEIYLAMGNHDRVEMVEHYIPFANVIQNVDMIDLAGVWFSLSHYVEKAQANCQDNDDIWAVFGHDLTAATCFAGPTKCINGIEAMVLMSLTSQACYSIPYPEGTDSARLQQIRFGL